MMQMSAAWMSDTPQAHFQVAEDNEEGEESTSPLSNMRSRDMRVQTAEIFSVALALMLGLVMGASAQEKGTTVVEEIVLVQDINTSPTTAVPVKEYLVVPKTEDLGKESEEPEMPETLFRTKEDVRKLLGEEPKFVYDPHDLPDPMIIPWVRREVIVRELIEMAQEKIKEGRLQEAKKYLEEVLREYPGSRHIKEARAELNQVKKMLAEGYGPEGVRRPQLVLPSWVVSNTSGVIVDKQDSTQSVVLVGDAILRIGEPVPDYDEVVVDEIKEKEVVYRYHSRKFPVVVEAR